MNVKIHRASSVLRLARGVYPAIGGALRLASGVTFLALYAWTPPVRAAEPRTWVVQDFQDFLEGEPESITLHEDGEIQLGDRFTKVADLGGSQIWDAVVDPRSGQAIVSGGDQGEVWTVDRKGKTELLHKSEAPYVYALATLGDRLWIGSSPKGKIESISLTGDGKKPVETPFDPEDEYIWALAGASSSEMYVGTGAPAKLYKVNSKGDAKIVFQGLEDHVTVIHPLEDGSILIGCSGKARVYKISSKGKRTVLLESIKDEVRALAVGEDGTVFAALVSRTATPSAAGKPPGNPGAGASDPSNGNAEDILGGPLPQAQAMPWPMSRPQAPSKKHEVVAIDREGFALSIWSGDETPFALHAADHRLQIGLGGGKARILTIAARSARSGEAFVASPGSSAHRPSLVGDRRVKSLVFQGPEEEVVAFLPAQKGETYFFTSHGSAAYVWEHAPAEKGAYYAKPFDAERVSYWGRVDYKTRPPNGGKDLRFFARSGNTETPGEDWTPWTPLREGKPGLPPARYFQWKAEFEESKNPTAVIQVRSHYLGKNAAPQIENLSIKEVERPAQQRYPFFRQPGQNLVMPRQPSGPAGTGLFPGLPQPPEIDKSAFLDITWKASDPDDDQLLFDLHFRAEDETAWKELEENWTRTQYRWDISAAPDGVYFVRVTADDRSGNPREQALTETLTSGPIEIDNTPPTVRGLKYEIGKEGVRLEFEAHDPAPGGAISGVEISVDAADWELVYPVDRIADSPSEKFSVVLPNLSAGEHTIVIKVRDRKDNAAVEKLVVKGR